MLFVILSCILLIFDSKISAERTSFDTVGEFLNKKIEVINLKTFELVNSDIIKLNDPPISLSCDRTKGDKIKILNDIDGFLFILSVNEFLAVKINEKREAEMLFVSILLDIDEQDPIIDVQVEKWKNSFIVIVQQSSQLKVFNTKIDVSETPEIHPIQKISISSMTDKFKVLREKDDLLLVTYHIREKASNELAFFKWQTSFFSKESSASMDLPNKSNLFVYNENPDETLILSIGYGNENQSTRVVVFRHDSDSNNWIKLHSMHFKKDYIEHYIIDGKLYLIGCSTDSFCALYKWGDSQFQRNLKISSNIFEKIKSIYSRHNIAIIESFQNKLSFYTSDDLISVQAGLVHAKLNEVSQYSVYKSPNEQLYFLEIKLNDTSIVTNFHEMEIVQQDDTARANNNKIIDPIECVLQLKAALKNRIPKVKSSEKHAQKMKLSAGSLEMDNKKFLHARYVNLKDTKINTFKMPYNVSVLARDVVEKTVASNILLETISNSLSTESQMRADSDETLFNVETINVHNLIYNGNDPIFKDVIRKSDENFIFRDQIQFNQLSANKLTVGANKINNIPLNKLLNMTRVKSVSGAKILQKLKVNELNINSTFNNIPLTFLKSNENKLEVSSNIDFQGDINVKHLNVKVLNGFNVSKLMNDVCLQDSKAVINGDLIIRNRLNVKNLLANHILNVPINHLMTTSTDQTIEADTFITKFNTRRIDANLVNGEDIKTNFALINEENEIEVPTKFMNLNVLKNLNVNDIVEQDERAADTKGFIELIKRHVIGTKTSDLSQIYNGKVVIKGSLKVRDMTAFSDKTKIIVNNIEVPQNLEDNYWMKSKKQAVHVDNFKIDSSQVRFENGLVTRFLNNHPINEFILLDGEKTQGPVILRFADAIIEGDVKGHKNNLPSFIYQLNSVAIPLSGSRIEVSSSIEFRNLLAVQNLKIRAINSIPVESFVHKKQQFYTFDAPKNIETLETGEVQVDRDLFIENYNNVNLQKFSTDFIRTDKPIILDTLKLKSFRADNLIVEEFENRNFDEMIKNLREEFDIDSPGSKGKRSMRIHGNVDFNSNIFIDTINEELVFNEFVNLLALKNVEKQEIGGRKTFQKDLIVTNNLHSKTINNFSTERLLYQSLSRGDKQTINVPVFMKNLKANSIHVNLLNDVPWNQLIDVKKLHLPLLINLDVDELEVDNLSTKSATTTLDQMLQTIQFPKRESWNYVTAMKKSRMNFGDVTILDYLIKFGVCKSTPQEILGQVRVVNAPNLVMKHVIKPDMLISTRTFVVDINHLVQDAVQNNSRVEVIHGKKTIPKTYRFGANNLIIGHKCTFFSTFINDVNVADLEKSIFRPGEILGGEKYFTNLHADEFFVGGGLLSGVHPSEIVALSNPNLVLPSLTIHNLEVDYLQTYSFNSYSFPYFLESRMRKYGVPSQQVGSFLTFASIQIENDTFMTSINDLLIDDAVFTSSDQLQYLTGNKIIHGNLLLSGPANIIRINGIDIAEFYKTTVSRHHDFSTAKIVKLPEIELKQGMRINEKLNNHEINELLTSDAHSPKLKELISLIANVHKQISSIDSQRSLKSSRKRLLYLDIDDNIDFQYKTPRSHDIDCENFNEIEFKPFSKGVLITKRHNLVMDVELPSVTFSLNPNFNCKDNDVASRSFELSWNYVHDTKHSFLQNFRFANQIADIKFMESSKGSVFMILVLRNATSLNSSIGFLGLDKIGHEWLENQPPIFGFYETTKVSIAETFNKNHYMIVSTFNENSEGEIIIIYKFDSDKNQFIQSQKPFGGGKFDIILNINVKPKSRAMKPRTFLLFSKTNGKQITIYRLKDGTQEFIFQRMLEFKEPIVEVLVLYINEMPFFIVSQKSGMFCLYEWRGIESWQSKYCGKFENIRQMKSFEYLNRQHLFLASTARSSEPFINALAIYRQGDFF